MNQLTLKFFPKMCFLCFMLCLSFGSLMGCNKTNLAESDLNVFRDRSLDYKKSRVYPIIESSKGSRTESFSDNYQIP